jgi:hypothetical protein
MTVKLFKIVTSRDEIIVGFSEADLAIIGSADAASIGRKLAADGSLAAWQYAVRRAADGTLEHGPLHKISMLAHDSLRIEPYVTALPVVGA